MHRTTVYRSQQEEPAYEAAYNQIWLALQEELRQRLTDAAHQAVGAVRRSVEAGDIERSFRLLEGLGLLSGQSPEPGPTSSEEIKQDLFLRGLEMQGPGRKGGDR